MNTTKPILYCALALGLGFCAICTGKTITVNAAGGANFTSIQAAISSPGTVNGDEIAVAAGTYHEAVNFIGKAVRLYSSQGAPVTIINGTGYQHVVQCISGEGAGTILEGFTITGGSGGTSGGGMYNYYYSSPTVIACTFTGNSASKGGGMANYYHCNPTVTECTFAGNSASSGGGMANISESSPVITDCTFTGNTATSGGGGMFNEYSTSTVTGCVFSGNMGPYGAGMYNYNGSVTVADCDFNENPSTSGGGMYNVAGTPTITGCNFAGNSASADSGGGMWNVNSSPEVTDCTFTDNTAVYGGGMANVSGSFPTVSNCLFSGNSANYGGGMDNYSTSPSIINCVFSGNVGNYGGGAMRNHSGSTTITNCTFFENSSPAYGGGIYINYYSNPVITNCTFYGNSAILGGGIYSNLLSNPAVTNCILWGNNPNQFYLNSGGTVVANYSDIQSGWAGTNNINADPLFINAAGGNLRLSADSPCIDAGDNAAVPASAVTDLDGNTRIADGNVDGVAVVDMGIYEFIAYPVHNVTKDQLYTSIQAAINAADDGDKIVTAAGTYHETIDFIGKAVRLTSSQGADVTIIDGTGCPHVVQCISGEGSGTILEGFTITGGSGDSSGGGMYNVSSSPTIIGCIFAKNSAPSGGGMYNGTNSNPIVFNCTFSDNSAASEGGAIFNVSSSPRVTNSIFSGNSSRSGGAMYNYSSSNPAVSNCTFVENSGTSGGSVISNFISSNPTVTNCILWGNGPDPFSNNRGCSITVSYSDIQGGWDGPGNIDADPLFVDAGQNDFRLSAGSPCIDAADSAVWLSVPYPPLDHDGRLRYFDVVSIVDTGAGSLTYLDMGAYEFQCKWTEGDINCDGAVDLLDLAILASHWLEGA